MEPITRSSTITAGDLMELVKDIEKDINKRAMAAVIVTLISLCLAVCQQVLMYMVLAKVGADTAMWVLYWISCPTILVLSFVGGLNSTKRI